MDRNMLKKSQVRIGNERQLGRWHFREIVFVFRASIHQAVKRLTTRSREVSKPPDSGLNVSNRFEIWQDIDNSAAELPVKFQGDTITKPSNLVVSRLH